jgi:hypothetical protein
MAISLITTVRATSAATASTSTSDTANLRKPGYLCQILTAHPLLGPPNRGSSYPWKRRFRVND